MRLKYGILCHIKILFSNPRQKKKKKNTHQTHLTDKGFNAIKHQCPLLTVAENKETDEPTNDYSVQQIFLSFLILADRQVHLQRRCSTLLTKTILAEMLPQKPL
jgi:hypothetical protein